MPPANPQMATLPASIGPGTDLSLSHSPLSALFAQPTTPEEWAEYALSEEQIQHFRVCLPAAGGAAELLNGPGAEESGQEECSQRSTPQPRTRENAKRWHANTDKPPAAGRRTGTSRGCGC